MNVRCSNCGEDVPTVCAQCWRCPKCCDCKNKTGRTIDGIVGGKTSGAVVKNKKKFN